MVLSRGASAQVSESLVSVGEAGDVWGDSMDRQDVSLTLSLQCTLPLTRFWPSIPGRTKDRAHVWRAGDNFQELILFFYLVFEAASLLLLVPNHGAYSRLLTCQLLGNPFLSASTPIGSSHELWESNSCCLACMPTPSLSLSCLELSFTFID